MKKRRFFAGFAAAAIAASMMSVAAGATATGTKYNTTIEGEKYFDFDKYLVMKTDATVPTVRFDFTVTGGNAIAKDDTTSGTMEILSGASYLPKFVTENNDTTGANKKDNAAATSTTVGTVAFSSADEGSEVLEQNAGTNTVAFATSNANDGTAAVNSDEKFFVKTLELDFSDVQYKEPGIYRYVITETVPTTGGVSGVTYTNEPLYLDVYVTDTTTGTTKQLTINSYVLHTDTDAPARNVDTDNDGVFDTAAGNLATKKTGFTNLYETQNLKFDKTVTGNQGSKDKYFKFDVNISNAGGATVQVVGKGSTFDAAPEKTTATSYEANVMATANGRDDNPSLENQQLVANASGVITGTFYIQHGQSVEIKGLPKNATYTVTETAEDYKATYVTTDSKDTTANKLHLASNSSGIEQDVEIYFTNNRTGTIPTGVILSIAAPAVVGIAVVGGLITLTIKRKREDNEE